MTLPSPVEAAGTRTAKRVEHYGSHRFCIEIGDIIEAEFSECSGPEVTNDVFEYQEGGLNEYVHRLPGRTKYSNLVLKRGVCRYNYLYDWFREIESALLEGKPVKRQQVTVRLFPSVSGEPEITWVLADAFPVKWVGPTMKVSEASVAIETLEFAHHGISMEISGLPPQKPGI